MWEVVLYVLGGVALLALGAVLYVIGLVIYGALKYPDDPGNP
ncbi:MAG TPA: hypothetical protein VGB85_28685 [Nannocystis sp.]|jgi:predicted membrane channel-forming protein YqfA (hemolysin III family)